MKPTIHRNTSASVIYKSTKCSKKAGTSKHFPVNVLDVLKNLIMTCSDDRKSITCLEYALYGNRNVTISGVVYCTRNRYFKLNYALEHANHDHHLHSASRLAVDEDGAKLLVDQFRKKHGRNFIKKKKVTKNVFICFFLERNKKNRWNK